MRQFVTDDRLYRALDEVEAWLSYEIKAVPMPERHRCYAAAGISLGKTNEFELWYIEGEPQSQATYCHELMHVVRWIDGDPLVCRIHETSLGNAPSEPVRKAWMLVQHIPIWHLVKEMGFDESEDHNQYMENLIRVTSQGQLYWDAPPELKTPFQAVALTCGLSRPATAEKLNCLRNAAKNMIPKALELADIRVLAYKKQPLFSPQEFLDALTDLLYLIRTPTESLQVSFLSNTCPNFRARILATASKKGNSSQE